MKKVPSAGDLLGLGGSPATAEQVKERERVRAHDAQLLRIKTVTEDGVESQTCNIRRDHFLERCAKFVDEELTSSTGDQLDRVEKGQHVSQLADYIFGAREPGYIAYIRKDMVYGGPVDMSLTDGVHVHCDGNGLVFKTGDPAAVEDLFVNFAEQKADSANRAVGRSTAAIERVKNLSSKRVPSLKETLEDHTARTQVSLQASVLAKLKALEPPVRKKNGA